MFRNLVLLTPLLTVGSAASARADTFYGGAGKITRRGARTIRYTLTGTITPDAITGKLKLRNHCGSLTHRILLKAMAAPAGAPVAAPRGAALYGVTGQMWGGVHAPVVARVAGNGRVSALWSACMRCGGASAIVNNVTPSTKIKADGTFRRSETSRAPGGGRYRVRFEGRFLADGAVGTLRARLRRGGQACDSGVQTWEARP